MTNHVYIATSLDGYIADADNGIEWLHTLPAPEGDDYGFADFMAGIDALLMGRKTYESVLGFDIPWPYSKPVFVLSSTLKEIPDSLQGKVETINGSVQEVLARLNAQGFNNLYVDGGRTIQSLMTEDLIDEITITRIPVVLGGGVPLFGELAEARWFEHLETKIRGGQLVQSHYRRRRGT